MCRIWLLIYDVYQITFFMLCDESRNLSRAKAVIIETLFTPIIALEKPTIPI